jgi:hypothetical protein
MSIVLHVNNLAKATDFLKNQFGSLFVIHETPTDIHFFAEKGKKIRETPSKPSFYIS